MYSIITFYFTAHPKFKAYNSSYEIEKKARVQYILDIIELVKIFSRFQIVCGLNVFSYYTSNSVILLRIKKMGKPTSH